MKTFRSTIRESGAIAGSGQINAVRRLKHGITFQAGDIVQNVRFTKKIGIVKTRCENVKRVYA